ncbi:MAG: ABC transporter ATP-binding protein, partial [Anaerolineae bacterium]|nr:ABC transporter ATP-binding protein [Anaerolineae bacterium]
FLMDEPLSNLDAKLRVQTRAELSKLHQRLETTFIYVTHDQMEAMTMGTRIAVLRDGILQQVDTPQNLYQRPDNIFVAGFIGSPAMNFFDATLVGTKDEMYIDGGTFRVKVTPERAKVLAPYLGKEIVFGIRPEDIHDPQYSPPGITAAPVEARVDVTELMGNEVFLYLVTGNKTFIARVDPRTSAKVGNDVAVHLNMDNVHIFDRQTERAIR